MRKPYLALAALLLCLAFAVFTSVAAQPEKAYPAAATNNTIVVSNSADQPDAHPVYPAVYKIDGANYCKLRDVAMLLRGSERQFAVRYDGAANTVSVMTGEPYTPVGGELSGTAAKSGVAIPSGDTIRIDGSAVTLTVFKIGGENYFKLRDLGRALDFYVGYDDGTKTVYISGTKGYAA